MKLSKVWGAHGARMGRAGVGPIDPDNHTKWYLQRVRINSGGYDSGGAYWGAGTPVFWAIQSNPADGEDAEELFFRAKNRVAAKEHLLEINPNSKFFN